MRGNTSSGDRRYTKPIQVVVPFDNYRKFILSKRYYKYYSVDGIRSVIETRIYRVKRNLEDYPRVDLYWIDDSGNKLELKCEKAYHIYMTVRNKHRPIYAVQKCPPSIDDGLGDTLVHSGISCKGCQNRPIVGFRYTCTQCPDYDLCQRCELSGYHSEHTMARISKHSEPLRPNQPDAGDDRCVDVHKGIQCSACDIVPIRGFRYRCIECENHNMCSKCEELQKHPMHMIVRLPGSTSGTVMRGKTSSGGCRYTGPIQVVVPFGSARKLILSKKIYKYYSLAFIRSLIELKIYRIDSSLEDCPRFDLYWIDDTGNKIELKSEKAYHIYMAVRTKHQPIHVDQKYPTSIDDGLGDTLVHSGIMCNDCKVRPIVGFRYTCIQCPNYDLCQRCELSGYHSEHTMARISKQSEPIRPNQPDAADDRCPDVHKGIQCSECDIVPIRGFRYRCIECENYNMCSKCEELQKHPTHMIVRLPGRNVNQLISDVSNLRIN